MKLFAIQHTPTGQFMPAARSGHRGQTFVEPDRRNSHCGVPRIFHNAQHAQQSLGWWLSGKVIVGYEEGYGSYVDGVKHVPSRIPAEWKVVEVTLEIV